MKIKVNIKTKTNIEQMQIKMRKWIYNEGYNKIILEMKGSKGKYKQNPDSNRNENKSEIQMKIKIKVDVEIKKQDDIGIKIAMAYKGK